LCGQNPVEFDGDYPPRALGKQGSDDASTGTNLQNGLLPDLPQTFHNARGGGLIGEKMLAEFRFFSSAARGCDLRQVDPLSGGNLHWHLHPRIRLIAPATVTVKRHVS
jgi:hypothetical protein